jgi:hypothetical protein
MQRATTSGVNTYPMRCGVNACALLRVIIESAMLRTRATAAIRSGKKDAFDEFFAMTNWPSLPTLRVRWGKTQQGRSVLDKYDWSYAK